MNDQVDDTELLDDIEEEEEFVEAKPIEINQNTPDELKEIINAFNAQQQELKETLNSDNSHYFQKIDVEDDIDDNPRMEVSTDDIKESNVEVNLDDIF